MTTFTAPQSNTADEQHAANVKIRLLGQQPYLPTWQAMKNFTDQRDASCEDEIWLLQHPPVFTQGQAGKAEHIMNPGTIPVVKVDRGGQVTYHGPGQLIVYLLIDIKRLHMGPKKIVGLMEQSIIELLAQHQIEAHLIDGAPGVFVNQQKIASLGLRVRRGCTFHGLSFNVDMDLAPFLRINPCGYKGLEMTQLLTQTAPDASKPSFQEVENALVDILLKGLSYHQRTTFNEIPPAYFNHHPAPP